jgi:hypothetical protein
MWSQKLKMRCGSLILFIEAPESKTVLCHALMRAKCFTPEQRYVCFIQRKALGCDILWRLCLRRSSLCSLRFDLLERNRFNLQSSFVSATNQRGPHICQSQREACQVRGYLHSHTSLEEKFPASEREQRNRNSTISPRSVLLQWFNLATCLKIRLSSSQRTPLFAHY